jgi:hypothetical protein
MKRLIALACLVAMVTASVGGGAVAATRYDTKLTISYSHASGGRFSGKVKSQKHACIAGRKVTVYRKRHGRDPAVGSDTSSTSGSWKVNPAGRVAAGNYYAKTPSRQLGAGGGTCSAASSVTTHAS